jgi:hypothetical protein
MHGPEIIARTLSRSSVGTGSSRFQFGRNWQYHSRSDRHSKVASWGLVFDLLEACSLLRQHAAAGKIGVGINQELRDFRNNKPKNLDLVIARSDGAQTGGGSKGGARGASNFADLANAYQICLSAGERQTLAALPALPLAGVSTVLVAVEAKAAMTAFAKARPRLKDELTGSHNTVHGDNDHAIAAGIVLVNAANTFISPDRNKFVVGTQPDNVSVHQQPRDAQLVVNGLKDLQRRSRVGDAGFDALGVIVIDCPNDGSPVSVVKARPPAPAAADDFDYSRFVARLAHLYTSRFSHL